jgi:hypothetical protein
VPFTFPGQEVMNKTDLTTGLDNCRDCPDGELDMTKPNSPVRSRRDERRAAELSSRSGMTGVPIRDDDIEPTQGLHWIAKLFRVMSGLLFGLMVTQIILGMTSTVAISYGVLFAEAIRLLIFAGLLWGAGDLVDLFVTSHYDLRAARILLGRLTRLLAEPPVGGESRPGAGNPGNDDRAGRGDATH